MRTTIIKLIIVLFTIYFLTDYNNNSRVNNSKVNNISILKNKYDIKRNVIDIKIDTIVHNVEKLEKKNIKIFDSIKTIKEKNIKINEKIISGDDSVQLNLTKYLLERYSKQRNKYSPIRGN